MPQSDISAELHRFREKLLDVSNRNPLLNYRRTKRRTLELVDHSVDDIFNRLVIDGKQYRLRPAEEEPEDNPTTLVSPEDSQGGDLVDQSSPTPGRPSISPTPTRAKPQADVLTTTIGESKCETVLNYIRREAATAIEETGVNYLFLTLGMLLWRESKDSQRDLSAPLLLIPVEIDRCFDEKSGCYEYALRWREEEIQANLSLAKRIEKDFGVRLPEYEDEQLPSDYFADIKRRVESQPDWKIREDVLVGFFSFQKLLMYLDIDPCHWEGSQAARPDSILAKMVWGSDSSESSGIYAADYQIDEDPSSKLVDLAIDADSSQHSALMDIAAGKNLVIEGPPGTGKSQTITNAIAAAISSGKSVLFVAEKLAALEVVHGKLADLGLAEFCLELHSDAASPRHVFESIRTRLDACYEKPKRLEELKEELEDKKQAISGYLAEMAGVAGPYQEPLYDLLWRIVNERAKGKTSLHAATCDHLLSRAKFKENAKLLEAFGETLQELDRPRESPWWGHWPRRLHAAESRAVIDQIVHLKQLAENAKSIVSDIEANFGAEAVPWLEASATNPADRKRLASAEFRRFNVDDWPAIRRLLEKDAQQAARQLVAILNEARPLIADVSPSLTTDLAHSVENARDLLKTLEQSLRPAAPLATWEDIQTLAPQLNLILQTIASSLITASARPEPNSPKASPVKGDALIGVVQKLGVLAVRLQKAVDDLQGVHGQATLAWFESHGNDATTPQTLELLRDQLNDLATRNNLRALIGREAREAAHRLCDLAAQLRTIEAQAKLKLTVKIGEAINFTKRLAASLTHVGPGNVGTVSWVALRETASLLPELTSEMQEANGVAGFMFPNLGPQPSVESSTYDDWSAHHDRINTLTRLYARCRLFQEEATRRWGKEAAQWIASKTADPRFRERIDRLVSLSQEVPKDVSVSRLLTPAVRELAESLCGLLSEQLTLNPLTLASPVAPLEAQSRARDLAALLNGILAPATHSFTWGELRALIGPLSAFAESTSKANRVAKALEMQGLGEVRTLDDFERAEFLCKLVRHSIIIDREEAPAALFHRSAPAVLEQGRQEAASLLARRSALAEFFNMSGAPPSETVAAIAISLRRSVKSWFRGMRSDYRSAQGRLAEFCRPTVKLSAAEWIERLDDLHQWQGDSQTFGQNAAYVAAFSDLFAGIETNWDACTTLFQWAATAKTRTLDHAAASRLLRLRDAETLTSAQVVAARKRFSAELADDRLRQLVGLPAGSPQLTLIGEAESRSSDLLSAVREAQRLAERFSIDDNESLGHVVARCGDTQRSEEFKARLSDIDSWTAVGDLYNVVATNLPRLRGLVEWAAVINDLAPPPAVQQAVVNGDLQHGVDALAAIVRLAVDLKAEWAAGGTGFTEARNWAGLYAPQLSDALSASEALALNGSETVGHVLDVCSLIQRHDELKSQLSDAQQWASLGSWYDGELTKTADLRASTQWCEELAALKLPDEVAERLLLGNVSENVELLTTTVTKLQDLLAEWRRTPGLEQVKDWISKVSLPIAVATKAASLFSFNGSERLTKLETFCKRVERAGGLSNQILNASAWSTLGPWYKGFDTNSARLMSSVQWAEQLIALQLPTPTIERLVVSLESGVKTLEELCERFETTSRKWSSSLKQLREQIVADDSLLVWKLDSKSQAANAERLDALLRRADDLPAWITFCRSREFCNQRGLDDFTASVIEGTLDAGAVAGCYEFTVLERAAEEVLRRSATLASFTRKSIEKARESYQLLDRELLAVTRQLVAHRALLRKAPEGISRGRVGELTDLGLLRHEIQKQRRHCRIRDLLGRAGNAVKALKPCFMMSPLSVAQFLDPNGIQFDLVIMDEASQVKPEDAIGTLLRAKQFVVVGDPKQLPPTSFFDRSEEDVNDSEATQFDNNESILEVAMKSFQPVRRLRWHYRSQHESLIHFSNERFYDSDLVVFPSASGDRGQLGVRHHFVETGRFEGGCNPPEAEQVARAIIQHAIEHPEETLGVGTFNLKQSTVIQEFVDSFCSKDSQAREAVELLEQNQSEPLFINNLETLQGHERDVILISYTYGPDPTSGRVMNRFGPVSGPAGWRRVNVLVTRARRRVEVFSSMRPGDIVGGPGKSAGVNAFKDYLEYADTGLIPQRGSLSGGVPESPFEESLARVIRGMGLEAVPQVGVAGFFIDIGVRLPNCSDFLLGVECDGATYHSARSARDRDRLREEVIRSRGWQLHRVWSTDWYLNQKHEEERLRRAILAQIGPDVATFA